MGQGGEGRGQLIVSLLAFPVRQGAVRCLPCQKYLFSWESPVLSLQGRQHRGGVSDYPNCTA